MGRLKTLRRVHPLYSRKKINQAFPFSLQPCHGGGPDWV